METINQHLANVLSAARAEAEALNKLKDTAADQIAARDSAEQTTERYIVAFGEAVRAAHYTNDEKTLSEVKALTATNGEYTKASLVKLLGDAQGTRLAEKLQEAKAKALVGKHERERGKQYDSGVYAAYNTMLKERAEARKSLTKEEKERNDLLAEAAKAVGVSVKKLEAMPEGMRTIALKEAEKARATKAAPEIAARIERDVKVLATHDLERTVKLLNDLLAVYAHTPSVTLPAVTGENAAVLERAMTQAKARQAKTA